MKVKIKHAQEEQETTWLETLQRNKKTTKKQKIHKNVNKVIEIITKYNKTPESRFYHKDTNMTAYT